MLKACGMRVRSPPSGEREAETFQLKPSKTRLESGTERGGDRQEQVSP